METQQHAGGRAAPQRKVKRTHSSVKKKRRERPMQVQQLCSLGTRRKLSGALEIIVIVCDDGLGIGRSCEGAQAPAAASSDPPRGGILRLFAAVQGQG